MPWTPIPGEALAGIIKRLDPGSFTGELRGVYTEPSFYREGALVKVFSDEGHAYFLALGPGALEDKEFFSLDGRSPVIHEANEFAKIEITTVDQAREYLLFFCSFVRGEHGLFSILQSNDDLDNFSVIDGRKIEIEPMVVFADPEEADKFRAEAFVEYDYNLFKAEFLIHKCGYVDMVDDIPLGIIGRATVH